MKSSTLFLALFAAFLSLGGCNRDEALPNLVLSPAALEQQDVATVTLDKLIEMSPTAAGGEMTPGWRALSYSEDLYDAYAERIFPREPSELNND